MNNINKNNIFIEKARKIHGDRYDYSKVEYVNCKTNVCIICKEHGEFYQQPINHLNGFGCKKCSRMNKATSTVAFIEKAKNVHGDKYDYSKVEYVNCESKVCIICPIHGEFYQRPDNHLNSNGCKECRIVDKTSDTSTFINKAIGVHGDKYDYSKVEYVNCKTNVCIICKEHGEFEQTPRTHLEGKGCNKCGHLIVNDKLSSNKQIFIDKAKKIHEDKYDYSKAEYVNCKTPLCIICPIHGEFWQKPNSHLSGSGCNGCGRISTTNSLTSNTTTFIDKAKKIHEDKYDYSKVEYINSYIKVCIICKEHGEFWQNPNCHLSGSGCKKCSRMNKATSTVAFIEKAKNVHGDKYDYSKVEYVNCMSKVCIICKEHGEFWQNPNCHLSGSGCRQCAYLIINEKLISNTQTFISKAKTIHGDRYDYSKVEYVNNRTKICIICHNHGEFWQEPRVHNSGSGCINCTHEDAASDKTTFITKAKIVHGDKYDYSKVEYKQSKYKVCIKCPIHGEFHQTPATHLNGSGCPNCFGCISKQETEIGDYIESLGLEVIRSDRKILSGLELDLYIPSHNLAIEYNGLYWHSEEQGKDKNYHLNKTTQCKEKGINLIHIFEDEYLSNKDIVLNKIKHILNVHYDLPKIMGRKCKVEVIDNETAKSFLNTYHIQGYGSSTLHLGAVYDNELIAVMSLKKVGEECLKWELTRFASNSAYVCQGIGGKLFKHFIKNYNPQEVKSFADRRWTLSEEDNLYIKLGFDLVDTLAPEYRYVVGNKRINKKLNSSLDTLIVSNLNKIWDCGLFKYVWRNN